MKRNLDFVQAMIRIMCGFIFIGTSIASLARKPYCLLSMSALIFGAMEVASGITRFCPFLFIMKKKHKDKWSHFI
ncbi:MAG TPA: DUF2892 domain-containing protein [Firmicutes bacterium]|nr:DUF2892 domain-containing protein [Bacillota bacterium]